MKHLVTVALVAILIILGASLVEAQNINNPTGAEFTASVDHAAITSYEIGWFIGTAVDPVSILDLGKPAPNASNVCIAVINVMPLPFNVYTAKVRAKAGTVYSDWSDPSNVFFRIPGKPGKPDVKR